MKQTNNLAGILRWLRTSKLAEVKWSAHSQRQLAQTILEQNKGVHYVAKRRIHLH